MDMLLAKCWYGFYFGGAFVHLLDTRWACTEAPSSSRHRPPATALLHMLLVLRCRHGVRVALLEPALQSEWP
jgi:hypothetical protein